MITSFLYNLKGQATLLNGLIGLLILAYILSRYQKRKLAKTIFGITILLFYCFQELIYPITWHRN